MKNEKLAQHISNELWVQKSKVVEVLGKFEETPQRDYTGVRFKEGNFDRILSKANTYDGYPYSTFGDIFHYTQKEVEQRFLDGTWLEIPQKETPTIHTLKNSDIEERVRALELIVNEMRKDKECPHVEEPALKRNLPIETDDWNKAECLSLEDVKYFIKWHHTTVETYIKNKLKSKATRQP
jgi:hypothetical protein